MLESCFFVADAATFALTALCSNLFRHILAVLICLFFHSVRIFDVFCTGLRCMSETAIPAGSIKLDCIAWGWIAFRYMLPCLLQSHADFDMICPGMFFHLLLFQIREITGHVLQDCVSWLLAHLYQKVTILCTTIPYSLTINFASPNSSVRCFSDSVTKLIDSTMASWDSYAVVNSFLLTSRKSREFPMQSRVCKFPLKGNLVGINLWHCLVSVSSAPVGRYHSMIADLFLNQSLVKYPASGKLWARTSCWRYLLQLVNQWLGG